jgi:hypothetical protein
MSDGGLDLLLNGLWKFKLKPTGENRQESANIERCIKR